MYLIGKRSSGTNLDRLDTSQVEVNQEKTTIGAEKIDYSTFTTKIVGSIILIYLGFRIAQSTEMLSFTFITPNFINLSLLGLGFFFHKNIVGFLKSNRSCDRRSFGNTYSISIIFWHHGNHEGVGIDSPRF